MINRVACASHNEWLTPVKLCGVMSPRGSGNALASGCGLFKTSDTEVREQVSVCVGVRVSM